MRVTEPIPPPLESFDIEMPFNVELLVGKVEATLGGILRKPSLKERGLAKQKAARRKALAHPAGGVATEPAATGVPKHSHDTPEEQLAAEGGPGETILAGGGGRPAI
ncbi:unnamed protein product [Rhizoctonia solani]|uniref:Uncharacterized protein n=2 Tax=Rhizoctonia solani TaxID=456999 RepID=A0A8H3HTG8_9AGAM|nr:unnamed protein product [Rhizoctonia solani]CAE6533996.1 unnamed protein product [Rhizoctonia solani]